MRIRTLWILAALLGLLAAAPARAQDGGWAVITGSDPVNRHGFIQVVGESGGPQSRAAALRSATVQAQRLLLAAAQGLGVGGGVGRGILTGALKCGERFDSYSGRARVCLRLYLIHPGHPGFI